MPATCTELMLSRRIVHGRSAELLYLVQGTASETDALDAVLATAPASYSFTVGERTVTLPRTPPEVEPVVVDGSGGIWEARVLYQDSRRTGTPPQENDSSFSLDTTGGTQRITQSLATIGSYPTGAPNFNGAIGFDGQSVQGCDITVPVFRFGETHYKAPAAVDSAYRYTLFSLTGKVNDAAFRGYLAGDVLFLGATGARRGTGSDDLWELTFHFAVSKTRTNFTLGGITVASKKGWEYLWVLYEDGVDAAAKARIRKPKAVYVEKVYDLGDFGDLGIGTGT